MNSAANTVPEDRSVRDLVDLLTSTPKLRAALFANPTRTVWQWLPAAKEWNYPEPSRDKDHWKWRIWPWNWQHYRAERRKLAWKLLNEVARRMEALDPPGGSDPRGGELKAALSTDSVFEEYFEPIARASQRSFSTVYILSWTVFVLGALLVIFGVVIGLHPPKGVNSTVIASVFGGAGAVSSLGSVYTLSVSGIRSATLDLATMRVVLAGFSAEFGQLRVFAETKHLKADGDTKKKVDIMINALNKSMEGALRGLRSGGPG